MKKIVMVLLILSLMITPALAEYMLVHVTATCYDLNHVGTEWYGYYYIGDYQTYDGDIVDLGPYTYDFYTMIFDSDANPDVGEVSSSFNVTSNRLSKGFTVTQVLSVMEDAGTYRGNWCEWYIDYTFEPVAGAGTVAIIH